MKKLLILITCVFCLSVLSHIQVSAMNIDLSDAAIDADEGGLVIDHAPSVADDVFVGVLDLEPGMTVSRSYTITNHYGYDYRLYLKGTGFWSFPADLDLIHTIYLHLELNGTVIYEGDASAVESTPEESGYGILLGEITADTNSILKAVFSVPGELGNEYRNTEAGVDWLFTAIRIESPPPETKPPETEPPETDPPETRLPNGNGPGGSGNGGADGTGRSGQSPKTGDMITFALLLLLLLLSSLVIIYFRKRKKKKAATIFRRGRE